MKLNFISTGVEFPYSYYLGVVTALQAFGKDVVLWYTREPKSEYFDLLKKRKSLKMISCGRPMVEHHGILDGLSEHEANVAWFDYLAWKILSQEGGIVASLNSITIKRWDDLLCKKAEMLVPRDSKTVRGSFAMHGVCVVRHSKLAQKILDDIWTVSEGKEPGGRNQCLAHGRLRLGGLGILPYLNNVYGNLDKVKIVEPGIVAGVNPDSKKNGFYLYQHKDKGEFIAKDVRTIPLPLEPSPDFINEDYIANSNTLLAELVQRLLRYQVWNPFNLPVVGMGAAKPLPYKRNPKRFRFHLLGLVHLPTSKRYNSCAFTQKNVKLAQMLLDLGHKVFLYGAEGSDAPCTKFFQTHTLKDIRNAWGEGDNRFEIGYNWKEKQFKHDFNSPRTKTTALYYLKAIAAISRIKKPDDFLLVTQGVYQQPIDQALKLYLTCEPGVGYRGSYTKFRAFESSYKQYFTYGFQNGNVSLDGNYYHRVIPNYFDPADFPFQEKKGDYYLFMGRLIWRKGLETAIKAVTAIGGRLVIAGQKDPEIDLRKVLANECCEYVGLADPKERKKLMGGAKAVFCPTIFLEPFCGVHVEAMLCGTPVITTNFGAFTDYVIDGLTGYKCNTLQDFVTAARLVDRLNPHAIRKYAERFTLDSVKLEYQKWFQDLYQLYKSSVDPKQQGWHHLE